jgi:hypothetical protein
MCPSEAETSKALAAILCSEVVFWMTGLYDWLTSIIDTCSTTSPLIFRSVRKTDLCQGKNGSANTECSHLILFRVTPTLRNSVMELAVGQRKAV